MGGGGGIKAANYVADIAPRDGTNPHHREPGAAGRSGARAQPELPGDLRTFNWVGNLSSAGQVVVAWHTSPVKSLDEAMRRES